MLFVGCTIGRSSQMRTFSLSPIEESTHVLYKLCVLNVHAIDLLNTIKGNQQRESAARVIQAAYRSYVVYWWYQQTREACVVIQAQWRGWLDRRRYQRLRWAVGVVGERYAAVRRGREVRREQERLKWAVGVIEERYLTLRERRKVCQVCSNSHFCSIHSCRGTIFITL